jgi:hypothetical protein
MPNIVNQVSIFVPVLVVVLLTFIAFIRMAIMRQVAVKAGQDPSYYKAQIGKPEPEATVVAVRHYGNMLELPTIFYAACLIAFVLQAVTHWTLAFAWVFVAARLLQSFVHLSYNNPAHRGLGFVLGVFSLLALWIDLALTIFARL